MNRTHNQQIKHLCLTFIKYYKHVNHYEIKQIHYHLVKYFLKNPILFRILIR